MRRKHLNEQVLPLAKSVKRFVTEQSIPPSLAEQMRLAPVAARMRALELATRTLTDRNDSLTEGENQRLQVAKDYLGGEAVSSTGVYLLTSDNSAKESTASRAQGPNEILQGLDFNLGEML